MSASLLTGEELLGLFELDEAGTVLYSRVEPDGESGAAEATDDADAFEVAERESVELILTEEELPTFDALMTRFREHPALSKIPVVIVNPDAEEGACHGDAYLLTDYAHIPSLLTGLRR
jgi:hypothetical protein